MTTDRIDQRPAERTRMQEGIFFGRGQRPPPCYRLLLLNAKQGTRRADLREAIAAMEVMLRALKVGEVRDLTGQPAAKRKASVEQFEGMTHLLAFGRRLFDEPVHDPPLVEVPRPAHLAYLPRDGPFPSLRWKGAHRGSNLAESDLALQLLAPRVAAVNCAAVEVWKLITEERLPLDLIASYDGFARHDGRGWLEFHDGVSNMHSSQRRAAIEVPRDPDWMAGGTYMAFLRLIVDLAAWRHLSRSEQELLVGRDRLSGAGLIGTERDSAGCVVPVAGPVPADDDERGRSDYIDPPQTVDPIVESSHVHRANQVRGSPLAAAALRIFRQGYEFLEDMAGTPRLGLNFVSFQRDLDIVTHLLHLRGWLGDVNFGGRPTPDPGEPVSVRLITLAAGGFYAVPPSADPFPGADLFE